MRFVGQDPGRGHALREASLRRRAPSERIEVPIAIVGGGVAGFSAAWRLARAGVRDLLMLELEPAIGGTSRGGSLPRSAYPMGAHYVPVPHPSFVELRTLFRDLGVELEPGAGDDGLYDPRLVCRGPVERVKHELLWQDGIYPADGQTPDEEAQWLRWIEHLRALDRRGTDDLRLFDLPVQRSSRDLRHLDAITMAAYLDEHGFTSWRLRWAVDYACRDDYGCTLEQTSAFAGLHHFLCRGLEDRHDRMLVTRAEGNDHLVRAMAERAELGERLRTETGVLSLDPDEGRLLAWDFGRERMLEVRAEVVLWAAPRFVLGAVLPPGRDTAAASALTYVPWQVTSLELDRVPSGLGAPLAWDNVEVGADHLGYVVATHGEPLTERHRAGTVVTLYEPWTADTPQALSKRRRALSSATLEELGGRAIDSLLHMHPSLRGAVRRVDVVRWGHAMIRPSPGLLFGRALQAAAAPIGRVLPCATDVGGLPLFEQAFGQAVLAAEHALARQGHAVQSLRE